MASAGSASAMETRQRVHRWPCTKVAELSGTVDGATLILDRSSGRLPGGGREVAATVAETYV
jgi:hypothetical protein